DVGDSHSIERERIDLAKASTREEIFRRLNVARDFMIAHLSESADLEEIAASACLSPFHFHRLFKSAFGMTPHEFIAERRAEKAKRLLRTSPLSMTEIAWNVGFETQAAFSKFFSRHVGVAPTEFRVQSRN